MGVRAERAQGLEQGIGGARVGASWRRQAQGEQRGEGECTA